MSKLINETRVILIGGSSHVGKSTLGQSLAAKLGWSYCSTDKLARHPGRPWVGANGKPIPKLSKLILAPTPTFKLKSN
jgi:2-phosphoglycerate kinase